LAQACLLLAAASPRPNVSPEEAVELVGYIQESNHRAKASYYRRAAQPRDGPK
jgi:hypothetical protein